MSSSRICNAFESWEGNITRKLTTGPSALLGFVSFPRFFLLTCPHPLRHEVAKGYSWFPQSLPGPGQQQQACSTCGPVFLMDLTVSLHFRDSWCGWGCDCHQNRRAVQKEPGADGRVRGCEDQGAAAEQPHPGTGAGGEESQVRCGLLTPHTTPPERERT